MNWQNTSCWHAYYAKGVVCDLAQIRSPTRSEEFLQFPE